MSFEVLFGFTSLILMGVVLVLISRTGGKRTTDEEKFRRYFEVVQTPPGPLAGHATSHAPQGPGSSLSPSSPLPDSAEYEARQTSGLAHSVPWESILRTDEAWVIFEDFVRMWVLNFEEFDAEQPDRLGALKSLGSGENTIPVLRWVYQYGSLNRAVYEVLGDVDLADAVAANMAQVSHAAFPDLIGFFDYTGRWKRTLAKEQSE